MRKVEKGKTKEVQTQITSDMIGVFEHIAKWPKEYQSMVQRQMTNYFYGILELEHSVFTREDVHRLGGAELVIDSLEDKKGNEFYVIVKILNKNAGADIPVIKLSEKDMPTWYKKDMAN